MLPDHPLPGSPQQQKLLEVIIALYAGIDYVQAVIVFGSLGQNKWDAYSDLDLAVVIHDEIQINIPDELVRVSAALTKQGEQVLFTEVAGEDGYVMLQSLCAIAINYHTLKSMSPYVLEGWRLLCGSLDAEMVQNAARANVGTELTLNQQVHRALWLALGVDVAIQRRQFWRALPWLEPMRTALLQIFAASRGGKRAHQHFEEEAGEEMKALFGLTFPQYYPDSSARSIGALSDAFIALLNLLEHHLAEMSNHRILLGAGEREVLVQLRKRQNAHPDDPTWHEVLR